VELSEAQVFGVKAAAYRSASILGESSMDAVAAFALRESLRLKPPLDMIMAQATTLDSMEEWSEARLSGTGSAALPKSARLREAAAESMHINSQRVRRVAQMITLESWASEAELSDKLAAK